MTREVWLTMKGSKSFYVRTYRKVGTYLVLSLLANCLMFFIIYFMHFYEPEPNFYATSGIVPPVELTPLKTPNYSGTALLPPDPANDDVQKVIPQ